MLQQDRAVKVLYDVPVSGVDYSPFDRAAHCPMCGQAVKPGTTEPPSGSFRVRYHTCDCGLRFKSLERDPTK